VNTLMNTQQLIGDSSWANKIRSEIDRVAKFPSTVLVTGPTGTGKEVIAQLIHAKSSRADKPMLAVDCASIPDTLFESQLFGHKKGSFTGADNDSMGMFRAAEGGTIFLDEIGELEPLQQAKLLRVLQTKTVVPVGSHEPVPVDVRVVAATNRDLAEEVRQGRFRSDLFYRLNVVVLESLALSDRKEDIAVLSQFFLDRFAEQNGWPQKSLSPSALELLQAYQWPGNVRELENMLERAALYSTDEVVRCEAFPILAELMDEIGSVEDTASAPAASNIDSAMPATSAAACVAAAANSGGETSDWLSLDDLERFHIAQTLEQTFFNQSAAARMLGVSRQSLIRKIRQHGIEMPSRESHGAAKRELETV